MANRVTECLKYLKKNLIRIIEIRLLNIDNQQRATENRICIIVRYIALAVSKYVIHYWIYDFFLNYSRFYDLAMLDLFLPLRRGMEILYYL